MGKVDLSQFQGFLVGQVIAAAVGAITLIAADFAGYYWRGYAIEERSWVCLIGCGFGSTLAILVGLAGVGFAIYFAVQSLQAKEDMSPMLLKENTRKTMLGGAFTAAYALIGALIWIITNLDTDWWLGTGFYGAFFGGLITAVFAKMMFDKIEV
ncbi:MAG: hypothetical protein ACE5I5_08020 [Candidatus Heimdallarchaeota archaeon]